MSTSLERSATRGSVSLLPRPLHLPAYGLTLFLSAGLLFSVQPMLTKMVLPELGGSPSVWNSCLCFFQAVLLLGYLYAHLLGSHLRLRTQLAVHLSVLGVATLFLPIDLIGGGTPSTSAPILWLVSRLGASVGVPFFAVSATAPLLQRWFSLTDHSASSDPYFLYASSNAGSLLALLGYPFLVEPSLALHDQSRVWSVALVVLIAAIALCWTCCRSEFVAKERDYPSDGDHPAMGIAERIRWIGYAFVPSSLLLGVTTQITTDLASIPLFWVVPLAIYLLTFILVFARHPPLPHGWIVKLLPWLVIPLVVLSLPLGHMVWMLGFHLAAFFAIAMLCHGELAAQRPQTRNLTEFYLYMSLGGVLGGLFNALLAPVLFPDVWEYPLVIAGACVLRPAQSGGKPGAVLKDILLPGILFAVLLLSFELRRLSGLAIVTGTLIFVSPVILLNFSQRRWRFALGVAAVLLVGQIASHVDTVEITRSFFGVYKIGLTEGGKVAVLDHGTTVHGAESTLPETLPKPLTYYTLEGPFGRFFAAVNDHRPVRRVGIVGLGVGSLGCYALPGQEWVFHEIDTVVEQIARDTRFFHFMAACGQKAHVVLGDARRTLHDLPDGFYDVLVIDAFSSDTIPVHLLTREAVALYQRKLSPDGVILFHISNRYLTLAPVISALAADAGAPARSLFYSPPKGLTIEDFGAWVVAVAQKRGELEYLKPELGWKSLPTPLRSALWTDQRSDIVSAIRWR